MARIDNTANALAARYNNDGQCRLDADDVHIADAADLLAEHSYTYDDAIVYEFADGSALAVTAGGWDTVEWDEEDGAFYSVESWGTRNLNGWRFPAAVA